MPKGALLHAHLDAMVNVQSLLRLALKHPNIHVRTSGHVSLQNKGTILPEFRPLGSIRQLGADTASITDAEYAPGEWIPLAHARKAWPEYMGGESGFDKWFVDALRISPAEAYHTHNTTVKVQQPGSSHFFSN